uniref:BTB domain-containing protein n=1 Tax=Arundo donax TaxID=35708 RepID=A0A0A9DFZ9_ARUDO
MPIPTTISTSTAKTEQGKHVFRVVGYSQHRSLGENRFIKSGIFFVGGHCWGLAFSPAGADNEIHPGCVMVALMILGKGSRKARASYELSLVDQSTGLFLLVHKEAPRTFDPEGPSKISLHAKKRSLFESANYLRDDCLTMECIITVIREAGTPQTKSFPKIEVPPSDIAEHFGKLLEEKEGVDVTFSVGGETFTAHRIVLATRSPVFKAELYGPMSKAGTEPITIEDMQPDVFRALLYFIYTDSLPPMDDLEGNDRTEIIHHLLVAADRYDIERLKLMCQSILCENLHVQTVATTLALANQHHCDVLKDACIEFIACSNVMDAVAATQGYKNLKRSCPSVLIEALEKTSKIRKT